MPVPPTVPVLDLLNELASDQEVAATLCQPHAGLLAAVAALRADSKTSDSQTLKIGEDFYTIAYDSSSGCRSKCMHNQQQNKNLSCIFDKDNDFGVVAAINGYPEYQHLYSGTYFEPARSKPEEASLVEQVAFWVGSVIVLLAFPLTVPLALHYQKKVRREKLL